MNQDNQKKATEAAQHKSLLKAQMLVGLLCNIKNGTSIFVQKLIGYVVFTGGLRAKATDLLCLLGVSYSRSTLDNEAKYWAENRDLLKELDKTKTPPCFPKLSSVSDLMYFPIS